MVQTGPSPTGRPRPVVLYGAFTAALGAFLGFAGLTDLMPKTVIAWVALVGAVATAAGAVLVQNTVTPLADPQDARGVPLKPVDVAEAEKAQAVAEAAAAPGGLVFPIAPGRPGNPTDTPALNSAHEGLDSTYPGLGSTQAQRAFPQD